MDLFPPNLTRRSAFSLVEVLVALVLISVVLTTAVLLLNSTRQVSRQVELNTDPTADAFTGLVEPLRNDVLNLMPTRVFSGQKQPDSLTLSGNSLSWLRLWDQQVAGVRYQWDEAAQRIERVQTLRDTAITNTVLSSVTSWQVEVRHEGAPYTTWPVDNTPLPQAIRVQGELDSGETLDVTLVIPAGMSVTGSVERITR